MRADFDSKKPPKETSTDQSYFKWPPTADETATDESTTKRVRSARVAGIGALFAVADARSLPLADSSVDLVFGSPPYLECRSYGIDAERRLGAWIGFMLACTREGLRVSKGLVLWVVAGQTKDGCYIPGPETLFHEAFRDGIQIWRPCCWHKVDEEGGGSGIPGSGGQWLRADWEYVLAFKRPGKLPFADPTFAKVAPKFPPGGAIRNRARSGKRNHKEFENPSYVNPGNVVRARVGGNHMGSSTGSMVNRFPIGRRRKSSRRRTKC